MIKPSMNSNMLVSPVSNGYVVYDVAQNRLHELNPAAALLLELCNGQRSVNEIAELASEVLTSESESVVAQWIDEAEEAGLLCESDGLERIPCLEMSADDLTDLAQKLREGGLVQAAYLCQEHAVTLAPDDAQRLRELGELAHIIGKRESAREAYERYLELIPADSEVRHLLTSLRDEQPPARVPNDCIEKLYERFASFYESNMCGELAYEGPQHLSAAIADVLGDQQGLNVLDLGCGTGLAGLAIRDRAKRLVGVDLSPPMIEQAQSREIYDELYVEEVTQWLRSSTETFDLIIACDTLIYFGDLTEVLSLAVERLTDDGSIAFSVERAEEGSHQLTDNGRYVHHQSHLECAARIAGMTISSLRSAFIRMEYGQPVDGLYVCLSRSPETNDLPETTPESVTAPLHDTKSLRPILT